MRAHPLLVLTSLTLFAGGCGGAARGEAKTGSAADAGMEAELGDDSSGSSGGSSGSSGGSSGSSGSGGVGAKAQGPTLGPASGPAIVTFPGFEVLPDGRSVVTVQVRGKVQVTEQKVEGRLVYVLSGVALSEKVNQLPLLTQHFPTQVTSVALTKVDGGANLIVELREPTTATYKVAEADGVTVVSVVMPRSEKYAATAKAGGGKNDVDKAIDEAGARDSGDSGDENDGGDGGEDAATEAGSGGVPSDADDESDRRRKKSRRQKIGYVERSLTVPHKTLAPDVAIALAGFGTRDPFTFLSGGVKYGIIDQVEIEASPHTFRLSPRGAFVFPSVGITAGYTGHTFEIAGRARYFVGLDTDLGDVGPGTLLLGVPIQIHLSTWGRIDTGGFVTLDFDNTFGAGGVLPGSRTRVGLFEAQASPYYTDTGIPFKMLFQPLPALWVGPHTGLAIYDFDDVSETLAIPLGGEIGITASNDYNPIADLGFRVDFPTLILPGASDKFVEEAYELAFWFRWFHHL